MKDSSEYFIGNRIADETYRLIAGDLLGQGCCREVRVFEPDPSLVLKFQITINSFQNVHEWQVWNEIMHWEFGKKWFAPCQYISPSGTVMLQQRTYPVPPGYEWPEKIPHWFTDTKRANFGLLNGQLVCHDYGVTRALTQGMKKQMRKADWWDD